ncbi:MAG: hypothetical protein DMF61_26350 [Blastocatellia bacterium AA13]|nr:MAG: hypothetical protein DMF61_26350 [Blastocatellia bacterium AA13]
MESLLLRLFYAPLAAHPLQSKIRQEHSQRHWNPQGGPTEEVGEEIANSIVAPELFSVRYWDVK